MNRKVQLSRRSLPGTWRTFRDCPTIDRGTDVAGCGPGGHGHPVVAVAHDIVQLPIRQLEESLRFAIGVACQPLSTKNGILKGDRQRRADIRIVSRVSLG